MSKIGKKNVKLYFPCVDIQFRWDVEDFTPENKFTGKDSRSGIEDNGISDSYHDFSPADILENTR